MNHCTLHYSNRLENLFEDLQSNLFAASQPFTKRLIIVPSPLMKSWIMRRLASNPDLNIAMGLEVLQIDQALEQLISILGIHQESSGWSLSTQEISLLIEAEVAKIALSLPKLSSDEQACWKPLFNYLKIAPQIRQPFSRKSQKRLTALATKLGRYFENYAVYGGSLCDDWEASQNNDWQRELWKRIVQQAPWNYPKKRLAHLQFFNSKKVPLQIHLFGMSFLPKIYLAFFEKLAQQIAVNIYHLSPCQLFWSDIRSDKEVSALHRRLKSDGYSQDQQEELEVYLRERNPLLANFGRLGREMAEAYEKLDGVIVDRYALSSSILECPLYEVSHEIEAEPSTNSFSLLEALQADLLLMRSPTPTQKIEFSAYDQSISIHSAYSKKREIEILYHYLIKKMDAQQHTTPIEPAEIIVMAPDMAQYAPYIKAIFGNNESLLDYQIYDLKASTQSSLIKAFRALLLFNDGRWEAAKFIEILDLSEIQKSLKLDLEELANWKKWIKNAGIRWGESVDHRNELLLRDGCAKELVDLCPAGTWEHGINCLIQAIMGSNRDDLPSFDVSRSVSFGKLIEFVRSLRNDLSVLTDQTLMSLCDWSAYLTCIVETYLSKASVEEASILHECIAALHHAGKKIGDPRFSWQAIKQRMIMQLEKKNYSFREARLNSVRFCSLLPMRAIPAKIIALIGMNEESFPRRSDVGSLNLLKGKGCDYFPVETNFDRYLFLEAILSARQTLYISYVQQSIDQLPSIVVSELKDYLDNAYTIEEKLVTQFCCKAHPRDSFHSRCFDRSDDFCLSYSMKAFQLAKSFYTQAKQQVPHFIPEFVHEQIERLKPKPVDNVETINIKELREVAKNPLKTYFKDALQFYLPSEDEELPSEENFSFSSLDHYLIKNQCLRNPIEELLQERENQGKLPPGLLKDALKKLISRDVVKMHHSLSEQEVHYQHHFSIELHALCREPHQLSDSLWQFPPLELKYEERKIKIVGMIDRITPQGVLEFGEKKIKYLHRRLPELFLLNSLTQRFPHFVPFQNALIFYKDNQTKMLPCTIDDPERWLWRYIEYFHRSQKMISPLHEDWVDRIHDEKYDALIKKQDSGGRFEIYVNPHIAWSVDGENAQTINRSLFEEAKKVLETLIPMEWISQMSTKRVKR